MKMGKIQKREYVEMMEVVQDEVEAKQKKKPLNKLFYHGTKHRLPLLDDEVHFVMEFSCFFFVNYHSCCCCQEE